MKLQFVFSLAVAVGSAPGILMADIVSNTTCSLTVGLPAAPGFSDPNSCISCYSSLQTYGVSEAFSSGRLLTFTAPPGSGSPSSDIELDFSAEAGSSLNVDSNGRSITGEASATGKLGIHPEHRRSGTPGHTRL